MSYIDYLVVFLVSLIICFGAGFLITKICGVLYRCLVPRKKREEISAEIKRREDEERMYGMHRRNWNCCSGSCFNDNYDNITLDPAYSDLNCNIYHRDGDD